MTSCVYVGKELELFKSALHWKRYFCSFIQPYIHGKIAEIGAGIGATTQLLCNGKQELWLCVEPDPTLCKQLSETISTLHLNHCCQLHQGTVKDLDSSPVFDLILYIDVLEHIVDDSQEIRTAIEHLAINGHLIIVVPAYLCLMSNFDRAIGHIRRYTKKTLQSIIPKELTCVRLQYLDSCGMCVNLVNRLLLKEAYPTQKQINIWDTFIVPLSRRIDPLLNFSIGKSLLGIWKK